MSHQPPTLLPSVLPLIDPSDSMIPFSALHFRLQVPSCITRFVNLTVPRTPTPSSSQSFKRGPLHHRVLLQRVETRLHLCNDHGSASTVTSFFEVSLPYHQQYTEFQGCLLLIKFLPSTIQDREVGSRRKLEILEGSFRCCQPKCRLQEGLEKMMGSLIEHLSARHQHTLLETKLSL